MSDTAPKRKARKPQSTFGRRLVDGWWYEQRADGVYVRRRYGRSWECVPFDAIRDYAIGQYRFGNN